MQAPDFAQRQPLKITLVILFAAEAMFPALLFPMLNGTVDQRMQEFQFDLNKPQVV